MVADTGTPLHAIAWPVQRYDLERVGSTNDFALGLLAAGAPEGTLVVAYEQYGGRGQRDSTWLAAPGLNLTLSLILRPTWLGHAHLFALTKITTLAVHTLLAAYLPAETVAIKWPNDLVVNGKKIAGILIENQLGHLQAEASIIGIGLNVNQTFFSAALRGGVTSQLLESHHTNQPYLLDPLITELIANLQHQYQRLQQGATDALDRAYLAHLYQYQSWARYTEPAAGGDATTFSGMIIGVLQDGRLAVQHEPTAAGSRGGIRYYRFKEIAFA